MTIAVRGGGELRCSREVQESWTVYHYGKQRVLTPAYRPGARLPLRARISENRRDRLRVGRQCRRRE